MKMVDEKMGTRKTMDLKGKYMAHFFDVNGITLCFPCC